MKKFVLIFGLFIMLSTNVKAENISKKATDIAKNIYDTCVQKFETGQATTADMLERNTKINNCLTKAVETEIRTGFSLEKQEEMVEYVNQIRKSVFEFYHTLYSENVYCDGACGSISALLPYADEGKVLSDILENLIYLNIKNNGYQKN